MQIRLSRNEHLKQAGNVLIECGTGYKKYIQYLLEMDIRDTMSKVRKGKIGIMEYQHIILTHTVFRKWAFGAHILCIQSIYIED